MALKVYIAHTGQCLLADSEILHSLSNFKAWITKNCRAIAQDQIYLNANGKKIEFPGLANEKEIFIYDYLTVQSPSSRPVKLHQFETPVPQSYHISEPPDTICDQNEFETWKNLFSARRDWSLDALSDCQRMKDEAQERRNEIEVIIRATLSAVRNVQKHVIIVDHKNSVIQDWLENARKTQESTGSDWNGFLEFLRKVLVTDDIVKFITGHEPKAKSKATLEDLIKIDKFKRASNLVESTMRQLLQPSTELGKKVDEIYRQSNELVDIVSKDMPARSQAIDSLDPTQLLQDIETLTNKISTDYENIFQSQNSITLPRASKCAFVHTKSLLPNIVNRSMEMNSLLCTVTRTRNSLAVFSIETMQQISFLTPIISEVTSQLTRLQPSLEADDALQTLLDITLLPVTYASFLAEGIRRMQWNENFETESSAVLNEIKMFQKEEARRRRKWQKAVGVSILGKRIEQNVAGIELKIKDLDENWPKMSNQDLKELLSTLQAEHSISFLATEVSKIISDIDNPNRQQYRCAKTAFKAGSLHESALGRSTLIVKGDNETIRTLQEESQKMASKLKTAESRVRRLENLLHQHTQVNRITVGNKFQLSSRSSLDIQKPSNQVQSPKQHDDHSRPSSVSSRRLSMNQTPDDRSVSQKICSLEAELAAEKERSSNLDKEILERKRLEEKLKTQIDEANSTKKDLIKNLEARQREFIEERKFLDDEIKRMQAQKEDLEDDLDKYVISRGDRNEFYTENEQSLSNKARCISNKFSLEIQSNSFSENTVCDYTINEATKLMLEELREEKEKFNYRFEKAELVIAEHLKLLHDIYRRMLPQQEVPEDFNSLAEIMTCKSADLIGELDSVKNAAEISKSDLKLAQNSLVELRSELNQANEKLLTEQLRSSELQETIARQCTKCTALETELSDEHLQLSSTRKKIVDLESDAENLRNQLIVEKNQSITMKDSLALQISRIGSLEKENKAHREKNECLQAQYDKLTFRFEARTVRAMDLTQRFSAQNDFLCMLLERLNYSITRGTKSMIIQKLPKIDRSNLNESPELNTSMNRSTHIDGEKTSIVEKEKIEAVNWIHNEDSEVEEKKYNAYLCSAGYFDIEAFCEKISKRIKDLEYTAKKYSRDARLYREKFHAAQKEAHGKIAFKNFKEGDLALFLPTRNQATGAWAAFNIGAPHFFLKEQDFHKLRSRDWLLARIHKIEDRVVDLSKSLPGSHMHISGRRSYSEASNDGDSIEDDNPFDLSDGLRWYLIEAAEERPGAPTTPGLGKSTVASANIDATGSIRSSKKSTSSNMEGINKTLSKNLRTRRDSNNSKKSLASVSSLTKTCSSTTDTVSLRAAAKSRPVEEGSDCHISKANVKKEINDSTSQDKNKLMTSENYPKSLVYSKTMDSARRPEIWNLLWSLDLSLESEEIKKLK